MIRPALALVFLVAPALAAPPEGTDLDSPTHYWFERQHSVRGGWCWTRADGHVLEDDEWRAAGTGADVHYEVRINNRWLAVPNDALRDPSGGPNPTGKAIVWYATFGESPSIFCFCPGFGT